MSAALGPATLERRLVAFVGASRRRADSSLPPVSSARWSPAASFRETSWQATALAAAVAGALAGLAARTAIGAVGTPRFSLGESVSGGAVFALVWYGAGFWTWGRLGTDWEEAQESGLRRRLDPGRGRVPGTVGPAR